jgi:hypothetical protein
LLPGIYERPTVKTVGRSCLTVEFVIMTTRPVGLTLSAALLILTSSSFCYFALADDSGDKQPAPRLVTIQGPRLALKTILIQLEQQTSNSVTDQMGDPDPSLDLDLKQITFWQALDAIAEKAGARVDIHAHDGGVALAKRQVSWNPPHISYSGLFRITLNSILAKLDLETGARHYIGSLEVAWEPHLLPLLLETRPRPLTVRDDAGRPLAFDSTASSLAPVDGRTSLAFEVPLPSVDRSVGKLSLLEGELYAVAPTKMLTFTFDSLDQEQKLTQEGVVCRVSKVVTADDHWSVGITLDYPEGNVKLDSYQSWVVNNEIHLESKDGADKFPSSSYLLEESTPRHAVLTYNFSDTEKMKRGLAEWKLVYRTPALVVKVPITFSFKDVPLP